MRNLIYIMISLVIIGCWGCGKDSPTSPKPITMIRLAEDDDINYWFGKIKYLALSKDVDYISFSHSERQN